MDHSFSKTPEDKPADGTKRLVFAKDKEGGGADEDTSRGRYLSRGPGGERLCFVKDRENPQPAQTNEAPQPVGRALHFVGRKNRLLTLGR
jgi:hypothetical protein